jgi:hypothetical protein
LKGHLINSDQKNLLAIGGFFSSSTLFSLPTGVGPFRVGLRSRTELGPLGFIQSNCKSFS